jgi:hypothetical protein
LSRPEIDEPPLKSLTGPGSQVLMALSLAAVITGRLLAFKAPGL